MPYIINTYNGQQIAVVQDGTVDSTTDIKLVGKNYAGFGEIINENFVHLLESFSGANQPPNPLAGQVWYNTAYGRAYVYHDSFWVEFSPGFVGPAGSSVVNIVPAPATSTSAGSAGDIASDTTHVYICVATNSWVRIVRDTW